MDFLDAPYGEGEVYIPWERLCESKEEGRDAARCGPYAWFWQVYGLSLFGAVAPRVDDVLASESLRRNREIHAVDEKTGAVLSKANQRLARLQKPPLNFDRVMDAVAKISESAASGAEKKQSIEALRKESGLKKDEMRRLFTKRLAKLYRESAERLEKARADILSNPQSGNSAAPASSSPQALSFGAGGTAGLDREIARLKGTRSFLKRLYPPPVSPSFWDKVKGAFHKVGSGLKKAAGFVSQTVKGVVEKGLGLWSVAKGIFSWPLL